MKRSDLYFLILTILLGVVCTISLFIFGDEATPAPAAVVEPRFEIMEEHHFVQDHRIKAYFIRDIVTEDQYLWISDYQSGGLTLIEKGNR